MPRDSAKYYSLWGDLLKELKWVTICPCIGPVPCMTSTLRCERIREDILRASRKDKTLLPTKNFVVNDCLK